MIEQTLRQAFMKRFRIALEQKQMSRAELSRLTGIPEPTLYGYYHGSYEPKQQNIYLIAKALNVTEAFLLGFDMVEDEEENQLLKKYNRLNYQMREKLFSYLDALLDVQGAE